MTGETASPPPPLTGEHVTFTGTLASMTHRQGLELVQQLGGRPMGHVSRQTTLLVVGEEGWPLEEDGSPSFKLTQALRWQQAGHPLRIVQESDWLSFVGLHDRLQEMQRHYTPAMLSQMLKVPVNQIRQWHRAGLVHPVKQVLRLPYFDYKEVASIQKLSQLIQSGVPWKQLREGLQKLARMLGKEMNLAQMSLLTEDHTVLYRDQTGWIDSITGQRFLAFDGDEPDTAEVVPSEAVSPVAERIRSHWTGSDWHAEAQRLQQDDRISEAIEVQRLALLEEPQHPEWQFLLAELLYRRGNLYGAIERFHTAIEFDHDYLEAWIQLAQLYVEAGAPQSAEEAFRVALKLHPECAEAHFHLGELLHAAGRSAEAVTHWTAYLSLDPRGLWCDTARQRLAPDTVTD